ncbi:MarR family winged helix-turn-helix transcriptional regulator [Glutamicibacter endophyticus]|uniref:MarR family winged helix-turn-helix transcriptional regulator n=1 Tax=Glutamicibacter endophyticus TaxID=1522174 RepID=UPI003AF0D431
MHEEKLYQQVEEEFTATLIRARRTLRRRARQIHPELQPAGYKVLALLMKRDGQQQNELAEHLEIDKATVSRIIKQLETQGLITRISDPADRRAQLVSITDEARTSWIATGTEARQNLRRKLDEWSDEDVQRFAELLHRLNAAED